MYGYIYKTTNNINGKIYIGQRKGKYDKNYLGSGSLLNKAIKKYNKENFINEVIEICNDKTSLDEKEKYWIKYYNSTNRNIGYNIHEGGSGGNTYYGKTSEELWEIGKKLSKPKPTTKNHILEGRGRSFSVNGKAWNSKENKRRFKVTNLKTNEVNIFVTKTDVSKFMNLEENADLGRGNGPRLLTRVFNRFNGYYNNYFVEIIYVE